MKTVQLVITITRYTVEIVDVCMRTFFTFHISGLFTEPEMKVVVEKVSLWTKASDRILKELFEMLDSKSGAGIDDVDERPQAWLDVMEANARFALLFERRFRMLCLRRIDNMNSEGDVSSLFTAEDELPLESKIGGAS